VVSTRLVDGTPTTGYLYDDEFGLVAELDADNAVVTRFVRAAADGPPAYLVRAGATYRVVTDQLGSVRLVVDAASGDIAQRIDYDEYGVVLRDTNPGFQPFGYAGGLYDHRTGLVRFGRRDYDAGLGRWLTPDPIGPQPFAPNVYAYCANDPVNRTDPDVALSIGGAGFVNYEARTIDDLAGFGFSVGVEFLVASVCLQGSLNASYQPP
jgi:RHS repeat-associated protein